MLGEHHHESFPKDLVRQASHPLELVHSDICGPMTTPSLGGAKYLLTFIDDFFTFFGYILFNPKVKPLRHSRNLNP
jgi:hypothetical protein